MRSTLSLTLIVALAVPGLAFAGKHNKGHGNGNKRGDDDRRGADAQVTVTFGAREHEVVEEYFLKTHGRGHCPPGLAKKNNGCLPPGQAKKRYVVGRPLPPTVVVRELPAEFAVRLGPPPRGYRYAIVDGDLVKLAIGTALVVDAISGLVN
jgi:Ni/Co efflux regulator RcnB